MTFTRLLPCRIDDILLRELDYRDAEAFALGTTDPAVQEYGHLPLTHYTPEIVRDQIDGIIAQGLADGSLAVLAIADADSDAFLGSLVLFDFRSDRAEVGFWLTAQSRGRGAAVKALAASSQIVATMGLELLTARTSPQNLASQRVLERAGFQQKGMPTEQQTPSGVRVPVLTFERPVVEFRFNV
ncbi:GNAT family N-acetyltransferase [Mycolicibacterium smegmatis]|jgi:ribosomal-protein-alanine N-acetyltransferase|uniref:GCN5-related N-acetyltransferase n=1 Tax=Mycolicibacterium smegmatis (strain ATCC 700084 / mc(2)155) TaxID=246196 RepID=A0R2S9_MYCS2|nr:GNAT family N-acetyltransferase [Mycolicibacterium smegmatis]ABK72256.1 GCN5-related N-acetyltransferase [Mycolicibacterium smegmatis MC2 155]AIU10256.1 GCN5 family acetyltransferase [Mycolicibacterium smegmatis MC2 155]AIU16881.1 GCN5 family acetyltransferase [Mycolicibacterium smegmatis]AIU23504.1 GCN5 family acetyltransferase [Mycolicibacterium smegmatis]MBE9618973.1 GNAT family N-acetyltransferase [Mycolicibacterium smegmatis]